MDEKQEDFRREERDVSNGTDRLSESYGSSNGSILRINPELSLVKLLDRINTPHVRNLSWEIQAKLSTLLNELKDPVKNDWRLVASRLDFSRSQIENFEKSDDPTMKMLALCNNTSTKKLFQTIQNIDRCDVIEDLLDYLVQMDSGHRLPTQESLEEDQLSELSQPLEESCSDISKLPKEASEKEDANEDTEENFKQFLCNEETRNFWRLVPGPYKEKKWQDFWSASITACRRECEHGGIDKFLCHIFDINYGKRIDGVVRLVFFFRLLNFFGPFVSGEDGCLFKMHKVIKNSMSKLSLDGRKHSWFAGYMNMQDAERHLSDQQPGTFLIRFSESKVEEGWFVLAVKTNEGVKQFEIEKDTMNNKVSIAGETYPDLVVLAKKLQRNKLIRECDQLLKLPCPNLPLNSGFSGYAEASKP